MGEKGFQTLSTLVQHKNATIIDMVVGSRDPNMQKDFYDEIKRLCLDNNLRFCNRHDNYKVESPYCIAIAWRWMIHLNDNSRLIVLHDSLLPKYRGFCPLVNMLLNKEPKIGVTALLANEEYDCGDIIAQKSIEVTYPIKVQDAIKLESPLFGEIVLDIVEQLAIVGQLKMTPQNDKEATYSIWRDEEDYRIDWNKSAEDIQHFIYTVGFPFKGASTLADGILYRVIDCSIEQDVDIVSRPIGKIIFVKDDCPVVICGKGLLKLTDVRTDGTQDNALPFKKFRLRFK